VSSWFNDLPESWPLLLGAALVAVLLAESAYVLLFNAREYRTNINRRLSIQKQVSSREDVLIQLKQERGIDESGFNGPLKIIRHLITQSGLSVGPKKVGYFWLASALLFPVIPVIFEKIEPLIILGAFVFGCVFPLFVLRYFKASRIKKFSEQLADAIDVIVRSLKAGHPLPTAITLVAREMPDPVGTEFGMVADELSFGLDLETAMRNMSNRVGQDDLPLFVTSISIQSATGGNLAAILEGLSKVIRDRFKMRRKIKALASEARTSAYVLIALPFIIFVMISIADPTYFDAARGKPETQMAIIGSLCWMTIGVAIMKKLVNMKI
jgi:tight adherence protein B